MLSIVEVVSLIAVALGASGTAPLSFALFHTSYKVTTVTGTVGPGILTLAMGLPIQILSCI
jgi:hypothetical protein